MKKKYISLLGSVLMGMLVTFTQTACSSDDDPIVATNGVTEFNVEPVVFDGIAGNQEAEITFRAGGAWTAMLSVTTNWVEITPTSGRAGEAVIKVRPLADNTGITSRSINLLVLIDGESNPYTVKITQESAASSDLKISGDVSEGVMTLTADATGNNFTGVLEITSSKRWNITTTGETGQWLSFQKDQEPQNGKETTVKLTVSGAYNKFTAPSMEGSFSLQAEGEAVAVEIKVVANTVCNVYEKERMTAGETERTDYELVDTITSGTFLTTFYVESNVKWELTNIPEWIEVSGEQAPTNIKSDGQLNSMRVGIGLVLKAEYLSTTTRNASVNLVNIRGEVLKTINLTFGGAGTNYLSHDFSFPASDPTGNEFSFEARASYIDPDNRNDYWKKMELSFNIQTSQNYASMDEAPYHMLLCKSLNGSLIKEEVHWATLRLGDPANNTENNGIYSKEVYLRANDRPDADDRNGITEAGKVREAFMFIVPKNISFNDLFVEGSTSIKPEYAKAYSRFVQKQDHNATYTLAFDGLNDKDEIQIPAEGKSQTYNITNYTTEQMGYDLKRLFKAAGSDVWTEQLPTSAQQESIYITFNQDNNNGLSSITLNVGPNTTSQERRFRFYFHVFRGDGYENLNVFQFDIIQPAN